jgi:hypothetical protein
MALSNKYFKWFGKNSTTTVGAFKSTVIGVPGSFIPSQDLDIIQSTDYENGFLKTDKATVEDITSVLSAESQKTSTIQQIGGITIYDSTIPFLIDSICRDPNNAGQLYKSIYGTIVTPNIGNALTDLTKWVAVSNIYSLPPSTVAKYSVNQAPLTAGTSNPAYLSGSGTNTLSFINISPTDPLTWTYADGTSRTITSNPASTTGFANGTYCVIFNESTLAIEFPLLSNVLEVPFLPTVVVNGQYICVTNPLQTYFGSGGAWVKTNFVKFAEFTVAGGLIGTITTYPLNKQLINASGYTYIGNGILMQWRTCSSGSSTATFAFPKPFSIACFGVQATISTNPTAGQTIAAYNATNTGVTLEQRDINNTPQALSSVFITAFGI